MYCLIKTSLLMLLILVFQSFLMEGQLSSKLKQWRQSVMHVIVSTIGDVFSFGILLLEMFTGKRPTDDMFSEEGSIKEWVREALEQNTATELVASALLSREDLHLSAKEQCFVSIFELAMKCSAASIDERINMIEAAAALRKIYATIVAGTEGRRPRYAFPVSIRNNAV